MVSKKIIIILGCLCLALPILGGCSSQKTGASEQTGENISASEQTGENTSAVEQTGENTGEVEEEPEYYTYTDDEEYTENEDGTYTCRDIVFQYKKEIAGTDGEGEITYVVLTNNEDVSFDTVRESLISATSTTMEEGEPEFLILGWYL